MWGPVPKLPRTRFTRTLAIISGLYHSPTDPVLSVMAMLQQLSENGGSQYDVARMSLRAKTAPHVFVVSATFSLCTALLVYLLAPAMAERPSGKRAANRSSENTLFVDCHENEKPKRVLSSVAISEGETWRAYVEVDVRSDLGCLHTTRLWIAGANHPYRLVYP